MCCVLCEISAYSELQNTSKVIITSRRKASQLVPSSEYNRQAIYFKRNNSVLIIDTEMKYKPLISITLNHKAELKARTMKKPVWTKAQLFIVPHTEQHPVLSYYLGATAENHQVQILRFYNTLQVELQLLIDQQIKQVYRLFLQLPSI